MAYSGLVSLSACKSYSRTSGSMRKYAVCGSMRELGGAGRAGNMEGCAKHAGAGGSTRKYAGVCGKFREVCGSTRIVWGKYAGSMETYIFPRILTTYFPHTSADSRILPHTPASSCMLRAPLHISRTPHQAPAYSRIPHTCACYRRVPHTPAHSVAVFSPAE